MNRHSTDPELNRGLAELNNIVFQDDRLTEQELTFTALWDRLNSYIANGSEGWRIDNLNVIEQISQRAHEIRSRFDKEMKRTLIDGPYDEEQGMLTLKWGDLCEDTNMPYETITDVEATTLDQPLTDTVRIEENQRQPEPSNEPKVPSLKLSIPLDEIHNSHFNVTKQEPAAKVRDDDLDKNTVQNVSNLVVTVSNESNRNVSTGAKVEVATGANEIMDSGPPSLDSTASSDRVVVHTNMAIPYCLEPPGEFTYKSLMAYNKVMNEMQKLPTLSENPSSAEFRRMRDFVSSIVVLVNQSKIKWLHIEPILMGQVIAVFPKFIRTQWALNTANGAGTFMKLREFLASYEDLISQGFLVEINNDLAQVAPPMIEPSDEVPIKNKSAQSKGAVPKRNQMSSRISCSSNENVNEFASPVYSPVPSTSKASSILQFPEPRPSSHAYRWEQNKYASELIGSNKSNKRTNVYPPPPQQSKKANTRKEQNSNSDTGPMHCMACYSNSHWMYKCPDFLELSYTERWKVVTRKNICPICLKGSHRFILCAQGPCKRCEPPQPHNSTLCPTGLQEPH